MVSVLDRAIEAHGGARRWKEIRTIEVEMAVGGGLWTRKGWPDVLKNAHLVAEAHEQCVRYSPFINPDYNSLYTPSYVGIFGSGDRVISELKDPAQHFQGHDFSTAWDDMHLTYFSGYAIWNYLTAPFLFAEEGFKCEELGPWQEGTDTWQKLLVTFPDHIATHCKEQLFYFDKDGLIRRMDYSAETSNSGNIAHYMEDHKEFDGIVVPTRRRTMLRNDNGTPRPDPIFVSIDISNVNFR